MSSGLLPAILAESKRASSLRSIQSSVAGGEESDAATLPLLSIYAD